MIDYQEPHFSRIRHDLKGNVRKQEIILDLIFQALKEEREIEPMFIDDMGKSIESMQKCFEQLKSILD